MDRSIANDQLSLRGNIIKVTDKGCKMNCRKYSVMSLPQSWIGTKCKIKYMPQEDHPEAGRQKKKEKKIVQIWLNPEQVVGDKQEQIQNNCGHYRQVVVFFIRLSRVRSVDTFRTCSDEFHSLLSCSGCAVSMVTTKWGTQMSAQHLCIYFLMKFTSCGPVHTSGSIISDKEPGGYPRGCTSIILLMNKDH